MIRKVTTSDRWPDSCPACGSEISFNSIVPHCPNCGVELTQAFAWLEKVRDLFAQLGVSRHEIAPETRIQSLSVDSLDLVGAIIESEETIDVNIDGQQFAELRSVGDLIRTLCR